MVDEVINLEEYATNPDRLLELFRDPMKGGDYLKKAKIFEYFSEEELRNLYMKGELRTYEPKTHVIIEGEASRGLFLLLHGMVSIYKTDPRNGHMIRLTHLEKHSIFGEISLFDHAPRSATVICEGFCVLFHLPAQIFQTFLSEFGQPLEVRFYKKCAEEMAERFRSQNTDYIISQTLLWQHALRKEEPPQQ